jgi:hypothetical protein
MEMRSHTLSVIAAASTVVGCGKKQEPAAIEESAKLPGDASVAPPPPAALVLEMDGSTNFAAADGRGGHSKWGSILPKDTAAVINLADWPPWTRYQLGDAKGEVVDGRAEISIELRDRLAELAPNELDKVDPKATLVIETRDPRARGELVLPPINLSGNAIWAIGRAMQSGHPFVFGSEQSSDRGGSSCLMWMHGDGEFFPRPCKLREIAWVLVATTLAEEKGRKRCGGYGDRADVAVGLGGDQTVEVSLRETRADIYDRRTGRIVESKTFPPVSECPSSATKGVVSASPLPYKAIAAWAKSKARPGGVGKQP